MHNDVFRDSSYLQHFFASSYAANDAIPGADKFARKVLPVHANPAVNCIALTRTVGLKIKKNCL